MKEHDFKESIVVGQEGEELLINYIKSLPNIKEIKDVREDKEYQELDIDFVLTNQDGTSISIEIKTDTYDSGNLFYETVSCKETGSMGCMYKTKADYIFYYFLITKELYMLKPKELREWFEAKEGKGNIHKKSFLNKRYDGSTYTSEGYTISKKYLDGSLEPLKTILH